jgi:hypothetical protein
MMKYEVPVFVSYHFKQFFRPILKPTIVVQASFGWHNLSPASLKKRVRVNRY